MQPIHLAYVAPQTPLSQEPTAIFSPHFRRRARREGRILHTTARRFSPAGTEHATLDPVAMACAMDMSSGAAGGDINEMCRLRKGVALTALLSLTACAHRDAVDTVMGWYHQAEGGAVAQQLAPPPGTQDPYPAVGRTPTTPVDLPSAQARQNLTDRLTRDRNHARILALLNGPLPHASPSPETTVTQQAGHQAHHPVRQPAGGSTSVLLTPSQGLSPRPSPSVSAESGADFPDVTAAISSDFAPKTLPQISALPPEAPRFPGFAIPRDANLPDRPLPLYALDEPHGTLILFSQSSDRLLPGQAHAFGDALGSRRRSDPLYVIGFGELTSFPPAEQVLAVKLGLLRAQAIAGKLITLGVTPSRLRLSAAALGHGGRIDQKPYATP